MKTEMKNNSCNIIFSLMCLFQTTSFIVIISTNCRNWCAVFSANI